MTKNPDPPSDADEPDGILDSAIMEAAAQLKVMWSLLRKLQRLAKATAAAAVIGAGAASAIGAYLVQQILRTREFDYIIQNPSAALLAEFGLLIIILLLSGYLWLQHLAARDAAAAMKDEIGNVRDALKRVSEVSLTSPSETNT